MDRAGGDDIGTDGGVEWNVGRFLRVERCAR